MQLRYFIQSGGPFVFGRARAREETAAVRSMANTARVLADNPVLVCLKELEAYKELAAKVGQVHLVVGDGAVSKLNIMS